MVQLALPEYRRFLVDKELSIPVPPSEALARVPPSLRASQQEQQRGVGERTWSGGGNKNKEPNGQSATHPVLWKIQSWISARPPPLTTAHQASVRKDLLPFIHL